MKLITPFIAFFIASNANAALIERLDGQAIYDEDINVTWLSDANYANTTNYLNSGGGLMNWSQASLWISELNTTNYLGFNNWRLPTVDISCTPFTCGTSELGHLYLNELGGHLAAGGHISGYSNDPDLALFTNIQEGLYWSGTEVNTDPSQAWIVGTRDGFQIPVSKSNTAYAWAVRNGDISAVPIPAAIWLFGSGLFGLITIAKRRKI